MSSAMQRYQKVKKEHPNAGESVIWNETKKLIYNSAMAALREREKEKKAEEAAREAATEAVYNNSSKIAEELVEKGFSELNINIKLDD